MFKRIKEFLFGTTKESVAPYKIESPIEELTKPVEVIPPVSIKKPRKPRTPKVVPETVAVKKAPAAKTTGAKRGPKPKPKD